ncbi:hypothetical protein [Phreatobacter stygius]|uniref:Uncharacterized protein n=1 Tax=Phreatobacter stygius TaxID=1940610 RepID=A0A4D7B5E9_9HYPH|nr:hypothetical protein [Phreatobacter stygius]QCI68604.1 hypothetical protein E8M01_32865 [Phreatobacter stygius]
MTMQSPRPDNPDQKRSRLLSPAGLGAIAVVGVGALAVTNGFGLGGQRNCNTTNRIATTAQQCEASVPGPSCATVFAGGAPAVGLTQNSAGTWQHQPLRAAAGGSYVDMSGRTFTAGRTCRSGSSGSYYFWGGGHSSGGTSSGWSTANQSQGVQRAGFGSTAHAMSGSSGS